MYTSSLVSGTYNMRTGERHLIIIDVTKGSEGKSENKLTSISIQQLLILINTLSNKIPSGNYLKYDAERMLRFNRGVDKTVIANLLWEMLAHLQIIKMI